MIACRPLFRAEPAASASAVLLATLLPLTACDLGPRYQHPVTETPATFRAPAATHQIVWPDPEWWRGFRSPTLDTLQEQARAQNFDIAAAVARVRQADAQVRIAGAALLPTLGTTGSATFQQSGNQRRGSTSASGQSFNNFVNSAKPYTTTHAYDLTANASYELDFWGRNRALADSAIASAVFSRFDQQTVALTVSANVASTWFTALAYQDRLAIAKNNLRDAEKTLEVFRARLAAGTANALDVAQEESLVAGVRASIPNLQNQMEQQIIGLGILTGRPPEAIAVPAGTLTKLALPPVQPGLPSDLLARRPDVAAAEAQLIAANANIRAARAAFFPTIQLTGSAGYQSAALGTVFGPGASILSLAANATQPIFDGGNLRGQLEQAKGKQDELVADYRKAVVQAFTDVENALTDWRYTSEQEELDRKAVETAQRAADIARVQLSVGIVDITSVLNVQNTLYNDQDTLAQTRLARFQALLNLYKALGGGWIEPAGPIPDRFPGLHPSAVGGSLALPVGGNVK